MAQFVMKVAGAVAAVSSLFESTPQYFRPYLTEEPADFSVEVKPEDLRFEQAELDREAAEEGFRRRLFTDPFLERAAIQRAFAEYLFDRDVLLLHGSAVAVDGRGYLFMAPSGTGKSTHTRLWRQEFGDRALMVNDDKPFAALEENGIRLYGSPWSGKHGLDTNICVPLQGICILQRGPEDRIRPLSPGEALPILQKQSYSPMDPQKTGKFLELYAKIPEKVSIWHMECTKNQNAARVAYNAMAPADGVTNHFRR